MMNFEVYKLNTLNPVYANAVYRWLNDPDKIRKFNGSKQNGEFIYLNTDNIDENVSKLFHKYDY